MNKNRGAGSKSGATTVAAGSGYRPEADKIVMVLAGFGAVALNITAPTDVDGDALSVFIIGAPTSGTLRTADGLLVPTGRTLSLDEFAGPRAGKNSRVRGNAAGGCLPIALSHRVFPKWIDCCSTERYRAASCKNGAEHRSGNF